MAGVEPGAEAVDEGLGATIAHEGEAAVAAVCGPIIGTLVVTIVKRTQIDLESMTRSGNGTCLATINDMLYLKSYHEYKLAMIHPVNCIMPSALNF